jgi:hypothetical protein
MTRTVWRKVLHKFIVGIGFVALITIMTGARVNGSTEELAIVDDIAQSQTGTENKKMDCQVRLDKKNEDHIFTL